MTPAPERPEMTCRHHPDGCYVAGYEAPVTDAGLREAAQQMWFAHTEDEAFRPDGPLSVDPYGEFEVALRAALSRQAEKETA